MSSQNIVHFYFNSQYNSHTCKIIGTFEKVWLYELEIQNL